MAVIDVFLFDDTCVKCEEKKICLSVENSFGTPTVLCKEYLDKTANSRRARFEGFNIKTNSCLKLKKVLDYCWMLVEEACFY